MKKALITGITGQDGAYLAAHLLQKGYEVYGAYRRTANTDFWRLRFLGVHDHERLKLVEIDVTDLASCIRVLEDAQPTEVYNLAAQSFVGVSFSQPIATAEISGLGAVNLLESTAGNHSLLSPQPICRSQALRSLDDRKLSRVVRYVRELWHPLQPRVAVARYRIRDAQDH